MNISRKYARQLITRDGARYQTFRADGERGRDSTSHDASYTVLIDGQEFGILTDYKRDRVMHVDPRA